MSMLALGLTFTAVTLLFLMSSEAYRELMSSDASRAIFHDAALSEAFMSEAMRVQ